MKSVYQSRIFCPCSRLLFSSVIWSVVCKWNSAHGMAHQPRYIYAINRRTTECPVQNRRRIRRSHCNNQRCFFNQSQPFSTSCFASSYSFSASFFMSEMIDVHGSALTFPMAIHELAAKSLKQPMSLAHP